MFCVRNKSPGGKLDYPNSGSGCSIEVDVLGIRVHTSRANFVVEPILFTFFFFVTQKEVTFFSRSWYSNLFNFFVREKWNTTPFPGPFCMTHAHARFGFEAKTFPQTILIKRKVCWHIFVFQSKTFVQTFWFQRKTFPQQSFLVCCNAFVQTVWIKSKIFSRKYFCFKARLSFRPFGFQARLLLKL